MGLFAEKRSYDTNFAPKVNKEEAEEYEKSFTESFMDEWHLQTYTGNSYSKTANLHDEYEKEIETIKRQTGKELKNPYNSAFEEFLIEDIQWGMWDTFVKNPFSAEDRKAGYYERRGQERLNKRINKYKKDLEKLKSEFPGLKYRDEETINADIKKQALEYYKKANDGRNADGIGSFLGAAAGSVIDPINVFGTLATAGTTAIEGSILKAVGATAAKEFINNAAIEAVIQPSVYKYKKELEIPYSKEEAMLNVAAAGVGSAVLGAAGKAAHLTGKQILGKYKKAVAEGVEFDPKIKADAEFLEQKIQLNDWLDETNPFGKDVEAHLLHEEAIAKEMRRLTDETGQLSKAYDDVLTNPNGNAHDALAEITPEDMEKVWVDRGGYKSFNNIKGSGFGMVKFIFKHGEKSNDVIKISKEDVINFPKIIREYEPINLDTYGNHRIWSIKRSDGKQIIYSDAIFAEDGKRHLVTIHAVTDEKNKLKGIFSEERRRTRPAVHTMDTAQKTFSRTDESLAKTSTPKSRFQGGGDAYNNSITPENAKVKGETTPRNLTTDIIEEMPEPKDLTAKDFKDYNIDTFKQELDNLPDLTAEQKKLNSEFVEKIKKEDSWDEQILDCILEFTKK